MGHLHIGLEACFDMLDVEYYQNKPITKRTIGLGTKYSPEFACLPFKVNVGNFIEALEDGANTLIFAGGFGPCRFGYYGPTQFLILKKLGYNFDHLIIEMVQKNQSDLLNKLKILSNSKSLIHIIKAIHLGYSKIKLLDIAHEKALYYRPREKITGSTTRVQEEITYLIKNAKSGWDLRKVNKKMESWFTGIKLDKNKKPIKIGIVGEIYTLLEPQINMDLEKKLGNLGVHLIKSISLSEWIRENIFLDALGLNNNKKIKEYANPYIKRSIGGHCFENIGKANYFISTGCQGIIHLAPLTCMPEIVSKAILNKSTKDYKVPFISIFIDEQTGEAGLQTRLEAFTDLLRSSLP